MRHLFEAAKAFGDDLRAHAHVARGHISASLFYEPSTRTRLSFESAMQRLGGGVLTAAEMTSSSAAKGESLADTVRVVSGAYADLIVLRHPSEGAARLASLFSEVPVINAGDGSHEHPTQTLCDLYSLWLERGHIEGLDVVLSGDLRYSRTVHSFVYALARFGANIVCAPHQGFELPDYVVQRLREEFAVEPVRADASRLGELSHASDVVYLTPQKPHQLSLFTDASRWTIDHVDAVYMTRPQTERHLGPKFDETQYLRLNRNHMSVEPLRDAVVMHPLPRHDEISADIDQDPRGIYFKQAARGVPIRMAILAWLLGELELPTVERPREVLRCVVESGVNPCKNPTCISRTESRHVTPRYAVTSRVPLRASCGYCSHALEFELVGCSTTHHYHRPDAPAARRIRLDHLVFFGSEALARERGYEPAPRALGAGSPLVEDELRG